MCNSLRARASLEHKFWMLNMKSILSGLTLLKGTSQSPVDFDFQLLYYKDRQTYREMKRRNGWMNGDRRMGKGTDIHTETAIAPLLGLWVNKLKDSKESQIFMETFLFDTLLRVIHEGLECLGIESIK